MGFANVGRLFAAALGLLLMAGCGSGNGLEMFPVRGEVTYNGKPLVQGMVTYVPTAGSGRVASGSIQPDGTFAMTTQRRDDGVLRGTYNIVVHAEKTETGQPPTREEIEAKGNSAPKTESLVPERYLSPETSGLSDDVDEDHSGFKRIELSD